MNTPIILAVDDDPVNLEIIEATFEDTGYDLRCVDGGKRALEALNDENLSIDLVILDRMMPDVDGLEVLRKMKENPRLERTPVVMQTAAAAPEQVAEGLRAGAYYYLTKPYAPAALRTIVRAALEDRWRLREVAPQARPLIDALRFAEAATFSIRSLADAEELAGLFAAFCGEPRLALIGFTELLVNSVEHGNLAVGYKEKGVLKRESRWREEIERRSNLAQYRERRVRVTLQRVKDRIAYRIVDQGEGFDWKRFIDFDPDRAFDPNGRGIALTRTIGFSDLHYESTGNVAVGTVALSSSAVLANEV